MDEAPVRGAGIQLHGHREVAVERSASCAPGIGFPRPAEHPVEYRPAAAAEPFCGSGHNGVAAAVWSRPGGESFRSARTAALQLGGGRMAGLRPPAVPVDARHGPQHLQGILHTSPKVSSDGAVGLGRSRRGSACCSTTSKSPSSTRDIDHPGPRATCTPGFGPVGPSLSAREAAPTSGGWCSERVGCLGYTPELPDHEVLRR